MLSKRIKKLREQSVNTKPFISMERASLLTDFYQSGKADNLPKPLQRALFFKYLLENKKIFIGAGELIVGERGSSPMATPTYPEICVHTLNDFEILEKRVNISFLIDGDAKKAQKEIIIPFWNGRSIRDKIFEKMDDKWIESYKSGVFTEFLEQRAPGHTVLDDKIYHKGFKDFKKDIRLSLEKIDFKNDPDAKHKKEELSAMEIAADALIFYAKRYSEKAKLLAENEKDAKRKNELIKISEICNRVPENAPESFWEALQYYWFVHLGVITELNTWDSFNPGRLDQHLFPFFDKEIKDGTITREEVKELLQAIWIKFNNQPAPPKVGVTAQESNTYTDFCLINLGGVNKNGEDAVNELSYILLDVIEEMRLLQPSSMVQISKNNPNDFLKRALKIIKTGYGQPSVFNTDEIIKELLRQGKSIFDARNGGASGCVESGAFGKESYILTGYFNLTKILEITLNNGIDPRTGKIIGIKTGNPSDFISFDGLLNAFKKQLNYFIDIKIDGNNIIEKLWANEIPAPFLSILIDDCIKNGRDYNEGGARYNTTYIQGVGIGSITDSLTSIKYNVYDNNYFTMDNLLKALNSNFQGTESMRKRFLFETPKYGNDDDYSDEILKKIFEIFFEAVDGRGNQKGGKYQINLLPTTVHVYFGSVVGATSDGRKAFEPLSEGISPVQGADINGPTAVLKSAGKIDHVRTGGTLLNQKFSPQILESDEDLDKLMYLIRSYFKIGGHHIQFNVVSADTLRKAQRNPEKYRNLIVRVAGYSDYFVNLGVDLQNEIIKRTEHGSPNR